MATTCGAGAFRYRITIEEPLSTPNEFGEPDVTWQEFATIRAQIKPLTGRERWAAQQVNAEVSHRITMRYLAGVLPTFRVAFGARLFDINAVLNIDERNRELQLLCTERVDGA